MPTSTQTSSSFLFRGSWTLVVLAFLTVQALVAQPPEPSRPLQIPEVDEGVNALASRRAVQLRTLRRFEVFHDFELTDRQPESGLTFHHRPVPDGAREYKMVHYDHGNGVAVADVDGDGRYDLYFVTQVGENELWRSLGGGRFENVTKKAGVGVGDRISVTASFADYDNDGDPDLYVTTVKMGNLLLRNDGKGNFTDVSEKSGLGVVGHSSGAVFFDYDRDGLLDLFLTNVGVYTSDNLQGGYYVGYDNAFKGHLMPERMEHNQLFRNLGEGRFQDVSKAAGIQDDSWSGDASFTDLNGDSYPDLYVLSMQGDDHYYENEGGQKFVEKTAAHFPKTPWGSMGVKFFDYNNDGRLDLILTDMHSDMSKLVGPALEKRKSVMTWKDEYLLGGKNNIFGNALYEASEKGPFKEKSDALGLENYWPWGLSVGDLNADGFQDVFITASMNYPFRYGINSLLINNRAHEFLDSEFILGVEPRRGGQTHRPWFDVDCSGADKDHDVCKGRQGSHQVHGTLGTRSSVIFDIDDDGDLDIVTGEFNSLPQVLVSNLSDKTQVRFLKIRLIGTASNRDGLGARVVVKAGGRSYVQQHDGKSGYLSHSSMPLYFGLADAEKVDAVEVTWPSGRQQTVDQGLRINTLLEIEEESDG